MPTSSRRWCCSSPRTTAAPAPRRASSSTAGGSDAAAEARSPAVCDALTQAGAGRVERAPSLGGRGTDLREAGLASHSDRQVVLHPRGVDLAVAGERVAELHDDRYDLGRQRPVVAGGSRRELE